MPQLFPMNWILISLTIMIFMANLLMNFYFLKIKNQMKTSKFFQKMTAFSLKW
uniref:ATP synthase F0 subunit 8 n=1 Tax=Amblyomma tholloni TaxID=1701308 RepID=UPI002237E017|nr:ATP synthase F0 subunit 8 [Amblyomma tholloni]QLD97053.1 ATP synthase F0 subunit 8 [Amblyomma tholloni]QLD97066.1 ATP synthase F0 subunit 8 [Amblyomma tholloni]UYB78005.1 ATP synthase F0 subunit 8 [Amblyomma tholloni]